MFGNERFLKFREADTGGVGVSKIVEKIDNLNPKAPPEQVVEVIQPQEKKQQIEIVEVSAAAQQIQEEEQFETESQDEQTQTSDELKVGTETQKAGNVVEDVSLSAVEKKDSTSLEQEGNEAKVENITAPIQQTIIQPTTDIPSANNQNLNHGNAEDVKTQVAPPLPPRRNLKVDAMNEAKKNMSAQHASVSAKMNGGQAATQSLSQSFTLPKLPFPSWVRNGVAKMMDKHPSTGGFLRNAFNSVVEAVKQKASGILRWVYRKDIEKIEKQVNILVQKNDLDDSRNKRDREEIKKFYQNDIKRGLLERSSKESDKKLFQKMKDLFGSVDQLVDESKQKIESSKDRPSSFSVK